MTLALYILWAVFLSTVAVIATVSLVRSVRDQCAVVHINASDPDAEEKIRSRQRIGFAGWFAQESRYWWLFVIIGISEVAAESLEAWLDVLDAVATMAGGKA